MDARDAAETVIRIAHTAEPALTDDELADLEAVIDFLRARGDGGVIPAAEADHYADGSFTTCPDCGGDLQYQNCESVTCLDCATEFGHYKRTNGLNTLLRAPDNERAARVYDPADDQCRDSEIVTDGGQPIDPFVCPRGHHSITLSAQRFRCATCRRQGRETASWPKSELVDLRAEEPPEDERDRLVTDGGQDLVYLPAATHTPAQTYHRARDCQYLRQASSVVEKPRPVLPERVEPCSRCVEEGAEVIVSGAAGSLGNTTYHTDPDCGYVQRMADTVRKPLPVLGEAYDPCSDCVTGEADRGSDYEETYTCDYCGEEYRSLPAALRCCGDQLAKEPQQETSVAVVERPEVEQ